MTQLPDKPSKTSSLNTAGAARALAHGFSIGAVHKALVEHLPDILSLVTENGEFLYVSPAVTGFAGYLPEELIGRSFLDYVHPDDMASALSALSQLLAAPGSTYQQELRFRKQDSSWVHVESIARNCLDNPEIRGVIVSARDVSDRFQAKEERRQNEFLIERGLQETIAAVAATMDARDPYTAGHQNRVANIATRIGLLLGLDEAQLRGLTLAASIHDLGKIKLPSELLSVSRRLTPIEYELIKTHAQAGYEILKDVHFPWPIAEIIRQHHEQVDGSGYPRGLKSDEILFEARIIAVADTVEAMASSRPYRTGLGLEAALKEITRKRSTSYDATVVDACLQLFNETDYQLPTK